MIRPVSALIWVGALVVLAGPAVVHGSTEPADDAGDGDGPRIEVVGGPDVDDLTFEVEGTGWPVNSLVQLELCGNEGKDGSVDCISSTGQTVAANFQGTFYGRVSTMAPPVPCPCVVRALGQSGALVATTPVRVAGVPELIAEDTDPTPVALRRIGVVRARIEGGGSWQEWLGVPPERRLSLKIVNSGNVDIDDAVLTLGVGSGDSPTGFVPPIALDPLAAGESTTLELDIEFDALAFGEQAVFGEINGTSEPTTFRATTSSYPWLLIVALVVVFQLLLLRVRNAIRRRAYPDPVDEVPVVPALPSGIRPVDDAIYLVSIVKDVEAESVMMIQTLLGQTDFVVASDRSCGPTMFAVRGADAVKELLSESVDSPDEPTDQPPSLLTELFDVVHVAAIGGVNVHEARATALDLAKWLGDELGVATRIDDPNKPDGSLPPPGCLRIAFGSAPMMYRIDLDPEIPRMDGLALAARVSTDHLKARLLGGSGPPFLCVRVDDWTKCRIDVLYDQVASSARVFSAGPVGLVPLGVLTRIDPGRWQQLGLDLAATYEVRIASGTPDGLPRALEQYATSTGDGST